MINPNLVVYCSQSRRGAIRINYIFDIRNTNQNYYAVCIVLSIGAIAGISRSRKRSEARSHKGVIRIISENQYHQEQRDKFAGNLVIVTLAFILVAPFAAPYTLGSGVHKIICTVLN